ncbi:MAG: hypothetical protein KDA63_12240 [Planctomycetales bacterium]|nr:hypothetical protein [Planctomycetales bacterium]
MPRLRQPRPIAAHNLTTNNAAPDLHALFGDLPTLPLALCADDNPKLWDETVNATVIERNKAICRQCGELDACAAWARNLGRNKLRGVVAGRLHDGAKQKDRGA